MLTFAFVLGFVSTAFEMMLAWEMNWFRAFMMRFKLANLVFSVALSEFLGVMFGGHGLIAMTGGIMSTVMSFVGYRVMHLYLEHRDEIDTSLHQVRQGVSGFIMLFTLVGRLLLLILCIPWKIVGWVDRVRASEASA